MLASTFVLRVRSIVEISRAVHVTSGVDVRLLLRLGSSKHRLSGEHPIPIEEQNERTSTSSHKSSGCLKQASKSKARTATQRKRPAQLTESRNHCRSWRRGLASHGPEDIKRHDSI
jgi:hypothetical protein